MSTKEQFWQRHILKQGKSGMSVAAYCQRYDIAVATFYYWSKKFQGSEVMTGTDFTEIEVMAPAQGSPVVTVYISNQAVVRIEGLVSAAFIRELSGC